MYEGLYFDTAPRSIVSLKAMPDFSTSKHRGLIGGDSHTAGAARAAP